MITFGAISVIQVMAPFLWRNSHENEDTVSHLWPGEEKNDKPRRLEISPEKSKVVNLKRQYSDFLGFKLKVRKKGKKYAVRSHMSDKAYKKAHEKLSEEVKKLAHSSDDTAQFMQLQNYNSVVAGLHEYYWQRKSVRISAGLPSVSINSSETG